MSFTESQRRAMTEMARHICVDAGAGSGKTTVLIQRVANLIEHHDTRLDDIVAITFTDAAATEMKERLRREFRRKAAESEGSSRTRWRDLARWADTARITTIHTFCSAFLRENALRIGLDPDFAILVDAESVLLTRDTVTETLHALLEADAPHALAAARELGMNRLGGLLRKMLGKRRLFDALPGPYYDDDPEALRVHWKALTDGIINGRLLRVRSARELMETLAPLVAYGDDCIDSNDGMEQQRRQAVGAIEKIRDAAKPAEVLAGLRELTAFNLRLGSKKAWHDSETRELVKELLERCRDFAKAQLPPESTEETEAGAAALTQSILRTYRAAADAFQKAKADRAAMDFDDLIATTLDILETREDVRDRTAAGIKFILIDEFQDTDSVQLRIAQQLAAAPDGPAVFIVGDAKQSIYDFREAEVEVFQQQKADTEALIRLDANFRTVPDVMDFINGLFGDSGLLEAVEQQYAPLEAKRPATGECRVEFLVPEATDDKASADEYRRREADLIADRLAAMCEGPEPAPVWDDAAKAWRPARYGDAAILFRSTGSTYIYEESLRRRGVPYRVVAGAGFYERQEVLDIRNLLTVLIDPWDESALLAFLRGPIAGLSDDALTALTGRDGLAKAFYGGTTTPGFPEADRLERARELIADLTHRRETPLPAFLRHVLDATQYEAIALSQFLGVQKAQNVRKLVDLADDFSRTRPAELTAFVRYLETVATEEVREGEAALLAEGGAVTLMTIHKAKGLEFPIVVVPDAARQDRGPDTDALAWRRGLGAAAKVANDQGEPVKPILYELIYGERKDRSHAEHARILYVALTRARDWLLVAGAPQAGAHSWMKAFDTAFRVLDRAHGETWHGDGWRARIYRTAPPASRSVGETRAQADGPLFEMAEAKAGPVAVSPPAHHVFSVSRLLDEMTRAADPDDARPEDPGDYPLAALARGTLAHRVFETWDWRGEPPVTDALRAQCPAMDTWDALAAYLGEIAARFRATPLGARMAGDQGLRREVPFLLKLGPGLVRGTIDALLSDGAVIDYKTGKFSEEKHRRYETQIRLYGAAVRALLGHTPPKGFVYYTDTGECLEVDLDPVAMEAVLAEAEKAMRQLGASPQ